MTQDTSRTRRNSFQSVGRAWTRRQPNDWTLGITYSVLVAGKLIHVYIYLSNAPDLTTRLGCALHETSQMRTAISFSPAWLPLWTSPELSMNVVVRSSRNICTSLASSSTYLSPFRGSARRQVLTSIRLPAAISCPSSVRFDRARSR